MHTSCKTWSPRFHFRSKCRRWPCGIPGWHKPLGNGLNYLLAVTDASVPKRSVTTRHGWQRGKMILRVTVVGKEREFILMACEVDFGCSIPSHHFLVMLPHESRPFLHSFVRQQFDFVLGVHTDAFLVESTVRESPRKSC